MEEKVGAYIIDAEGNLIPDLNDEAMKNRHMKEPEVKWHEKKNQSKEVKENAISE